MTDTNPVAAAKPNTSSTELALKDENLVSQSDHLKLERGATA